MEESESGKESKPVEMEETAFLSVSKNEIEKDKKAKATRETAFKYCMTGTPSPVWNSVVTRHMKKEEARIQGTHFRGVTTTKSKRKPKRKPKKKKRALGRDEIPFDRYDVWNSVMDVFIQQIKRSFDKTEEKPQLFNHVGYFIQGLDIEGIEDVQSLTSIQYSIILERLKYEIQYLKIIEGGKKRGMTDPVGKVKTYWEALRDEQFLDEGPRSVDGRTAYVKEKMPFVLNSIARYGIPVHEQLKLEYFYPEIVLHKLLTFQYFKESIELSSQHDCIRQWKIKCLAKQMLFRSEKPTIREKMLEHHLWRGGSFKIDVFENVSKEDRDWLLQKEKEHLKQQKKVEAAKEKENPKKKEKKKKKRRRVSKKRVSGSTINKVSHASNSAKKEGSVLNHVKNINYIAEAFRTCNFQDKQYSAGLTRTISAEEKRKGEVLMEKLWKEKGIWSIDQYEEIKGFDEKTTFQDIQKYRIEEEEEEDGESEEEEINDSDVLEICDMFPLSALGCRLLVYILSLVMNKNWRMNAEVCGTMFLLTRLYPVQNFAQIKFYCNEARGDIKLGLNRISQVIEALGEADICHILSRLDPFYYNEEQLRLGVQTRESIGNIDLETITGASLEFGCRKESLKQVKMGNIENLGGNEMVIDFKSIKNLKHLIEGGRPAKVTKGSCRI